MKKVGKEWADYCKAQGENLVRPILIVQVQDGDGKKVISKTDLAEAIKCIRAELGEMPNEAFAHAFQETTRIEADGQEVRYVAPPDIQGDPDVRVVFFKSSLNTGWDCPRAEVMMKLPPRAGRNAHRPARADGWSARPSPAASTPTSG